MAAFIIGYRLLPKNPPKLAQQCRTYALSRFPIRTTGFGRSSRGNISRRSQPSLPPEDRPWTSSDHEEKPSADQSHPWSLNTRSTADPEVDLKRLLLNNDELVITRQLEMLNIFMGFEQSNRYVMTNMAGEALGYIVEEPRGLFSMFARQLFRTHRSFRALIMDTEGSPILWIRRPFSWINSRMFVQRPRDYLTSASDGELVLDTFAEVQQEWHLWRRRYDLFLRFHTARRGSVNGTFQFGRSAPQRVLILDSDPKSEISAPGAHFNQFARIDEGLWAWYFVLRDAQGQGIATVNRGFRGFGREIFTDTGKYTVSFRGPDEQIYTSSEQNEQILHKPSVARNLTVDERALVLAMAINIDYDYFSRHSEGGYGFSFWSSGE